MTFSDTGLLLFSDDVTEERSSRKNSEVYRDISSAQIQSNGAKLIGRHFIEQKDNDPKHTAKATQEFIKVKIIYIFCSGLKAERPTKKQQLKSAAVKA